MLDSAFTGRDENTVHALTGKRLAKFDTRISRPGGNSQQDLRKLSCPAGLLFVAIIRLGAHFNGLAKANPRLNQVEVDIEPSAKALRDDVKMEFTLCRNDGLVKLGIRHELKRRILIVQGGKSGGNFVFLPSRPGLERGPESGFGITRAWQLHRPVCLAQSVAGVRAFELYGGPDVAGSQLSYRRAV